MTSIMPSPSYDPTNSGNKPGEGPLRIGGTQLPGMPGSDKDLPSAMSPIVKMQQPDLLMVRDLAAGPGRIRERKTVYLPQAPAENARSYNSRLMRSVFINFYLKTVRGLTGFIFRKDPELGDDVPPMIVEHAENIDLAGTHLDVFLREQLQDSMIAGHSAILVDYPNTGGRPMTLADEQGLRPYWIPIKKDNILSWRTTIEDGRMVLTQIVIKECTYVSDGEFGEKEHIQYRVLRRDGIGEQAIVTFQVLAVNERNLVIELERGMYRNQIEIPIAEVVTSGRRALFESDPPLIDLAFLNLGHYQMWSDYATSIHYTCVPILFTAGFDLGDDDTTTVVVGTNSGLSAPDSNAKAEYVSHDGNALEAVRQALLDMKDDMASLGIAMLTGAKKVAETAEAKRIGKSDTDSALSVTARGLQDGAERALGFHARYLGMEKGGSIKINREFENMQMQSDMLTAFVAAVKDAGLPIRLLLQNMQEGGLISPEIDLDDLVLEMEANIQAAADQAATEAAANAAALENNNGGDPKNPDDGTSKGGQREPGSKDDGGSSTQ